MTVLGYIKKTLILLSLFGVGYLGMGVWKLWSSYAFSRDAEKQQGDERTPEGKYVLDYKNTNSSYYKSIHISCPNDQDRDNARKRNVSPGGNSMIHGQPNRWGKFSFITQYCNWTNGCIALSNSAMDAVWNAVDPGTPIQIRPQYGRGLTPCPF